MTFVDRHVLLLNLNFEVIDVIGWRRAMRLICKDRVKIHEEFEDSSVGCGTSAKERYKMPSVLVLKEYVGFYKNAKKIVNLNKKNVLLRDNHTCLYCGKALTDLTGTMDHVIPQSRKGPHRWDNIVAACLKCNRKKDDQLLHEAGLKLLREPFVPTRNIFFRKYIRKDEYASWKNYIKGRDVS